MTSSLMAAKKCLEEKNSTCAVYLEKENRFLVSHERGIKPVLNWIRQKPDILRGSFVADRVIGKAAALLMIYGGVQEVYGGIISRHAQDCFQHWDVPCFYGSIVPYIINRDKTGMCPMEQRSLTITTPEEAFQVFSQMLPADANN